MRVRKLVVLVIGMLLFLFFGNRAYLVFNDSDVLDNTRWELNYFVIDGVRTSEFVGGQWVQFEEVKFFGNDTCNYFNGEYKVNKQGDFGFEFYAITAVACHVIDQDTNENTRMGDKEFSGAFHSINAFEIKGDRLWLYYSEDKNNALVFEPAVVN